MVTGAAGFVGRHLVAALAEHGGRVTALDSDGARLAALAGAEVVRSGDVRDGPWLEGVVRDAEPHSIFHLAGAIGTASEDAGAFFDRNVAPTLALLEVVRRAAPEATVLLASSSAVYGDAGGPVPVGEDTPLRPRTSYGASKACQEMLALQYFLGHGLRTVRVRTFNLVGPGQSPALVAAAVARQIVDCERCGGDTVLVGATHGRRDFLDVRDAVAAYRLLAERGTPGEVYNVCSGRSHAIQDCVDVLVGHALRAVAVARDPGRMRGIDVLEQVGDNARLRAATGWEPRIDLETSLVDLLEDVRGRDPK